MSQDIEIDPDSRTIKHYDNRTEQSIRDFIESGGKLLSRTDAITLLDEIDRLRKTSADFHQAGLDLCVENERLARENSEQAQRMKEILLKVERLEKLVPHETERGTGFVGQGTWSVYAEKVVAERDELRDELNGLCEEIRCLKEENDELKEEMRLLSNVTSSKKEHTDIDTNGDEPHAISGYGKFKLIRTTEDSQWMLFLNKESIMLYNRKGKRVRAKFTEW